MNRIRDLRKAIDMKQIDLARYLKVGQNTISNWETGKTEPDFESLKRMSDLFSCSTDHLLGNKPHEEKTATPKDDGPREEFGRIFDSLTQDQQEFVIAAMRGMQREI